MSWFRLLLNVLALPTLAWATDIPTYHLRLKATGKDEGRALATVVVGNCPAGTLNLPLGFSTLEELKLEEAPPGVTLELGLRDTITSLHFHLSNAITNPVTLSFSFLVKPIFQPLKTLPGEKATLPAGSRLFRHAFVNTQEVPIGAYRIQFLFPDGMIAQAIREQLPKPEKQEVGPRVILSAIEGRQAATLTYANVHQGDDTSMVLELVPARRSFGWLIAGLLLGGLYLFKFKDLVAKKPT
jgi:hypothetical protein